MNKNVEKALQNDNLLLFIAEYHETCGHTKIASMEGLMKRFAEFKMLVKRGSFTIDQLEDRVVSQFSV